MRPIRRAAERRTRSRQLSRKASVETATIVKPGSDETVNKSSSSSGSKRAGNSAQLAESLDSIIISNFHYYLQDGRPTRYYNRRAGQDHRHPIYRRKSSWQQERHK